MMLGSMAERCVCVCVCWGGGGGGGGAHGRVVLWQYTMHHSLCVYTDCRLSCTCWRESACSISSATGTPASQGREAHYN